MYTFDSEESFMITASVLAVGSLFLGFWAGKMTSSRSEILKNPAPAGSSSSRNTSGVVATDGNEDDCKMVLVVRTDLGMSSGKIAAQCSHATLACYKTLLDKNPAMLRQWEHSGQTKVALQCKDEGDLLTMQTRAQGLNLCAQSIRDAGRTQIAAGSRTVLGIVGPSRLVNKVTGALRLLA